MAEGIERELRDLDVDRPLPAPLYGRLEAALLEEAQGGGRAAGLFDALDAPRPIPPATRAALERALTAGTHRRDRRSVLLGVAAAVLLVVGTVAALRSSGSPSNRQIAAGPGGTVPGAGVPPVLLAPSTTAAPLPVIVGAPPPAPPTTRRGSTTTTTTWDCGLCARNGYTGSAAAAAATSGGSAGTWRPGGTSTPAAPAAATAPSAYISTVDPSSGPRRGGTLVTLTGKGFTGAGGVVFGSTAAANFTVVSDTEIRVEAPASPELQKAAVAVTYPDGSTTPTHEGSASFTYT